MQLHVYNQECSLCIKCTDTCIYSVIGRHLQADGWKIVSAADDKTLKVLEN